LQEYYASWLVAVWAGLIVVLSGRLYNNWCYWRTWHAESTSDWALRFTVGTIASGCLWGLVGSTLLLASDPAHLAFTAFVVGGLTAAAAVSNSAYLPAMIGFVAPIALPTIFVLFYLATPMSLAMGLVAAACSAALLGLSLRINRWIRSIAARQITQARLTDSLRNRGDLLHAISVAAKELLIAPAIELAMARSLPYRRPRS
jgi:hypothetical protein